MFNDARAGASAAKPPATRAARKQATARAVLDAARAEFERVGYEAASLRTIAARADSAHCPPTTEAFRRWLAGRISAFLLAGSPETNAASRPLTLRRADGIPGG